MAGYNYPSSFSPSGIESPAASVSSQNSTMPICASGEVELKEDIAALRQAPTKEYTGYGQLPSKDYIVLDSPDIRSHSPPVRRPRLNHRALHSYGHGRRVSGGSSSAKTSRIEFYEDGFGYGLYYWNAAAATKRQDELVINGLSLA
ncbi:SubName: Full=Uncharacterized protein {ECO:0000313/EMBL:CCA69161.1} [Serendipita indica DSM 11827]|nr:SubName: Full=Uncharacterized protein {ECO:0000313/EMBL:CCA69161.1} [Serendipita indica DSM 11827]